MNTDFGAQNMDDPGNFMRAYHELIHTYASEQMDLPWFFTPRVEWKRRKLAKQIRSTLAAVVHDAYAERKTVTAKSRSILSLSLQHDIGPLTAQVVDQVCDQLSTFLFAGHDTTSILVSWMFYELARTPHALRALRSELDGIFGPSEWHCLLTHDILFLLSLSHLYLGAGD